MDEKLLKIIMDTMLPLFGEQDMKESKDAPGVYLNDKKAVKVEYDESRSMVFMYAADIAEGEAVDFREISGWLFDESHGERDAKVIGDDFDESLREELGIKKTALGSRKDIALPSKNVAGETPNVEALAQRFLAIFPQYKDVYKEHIAQYREFLYEDFFSKTAAVQLKELIADPGPNKKKLIKLFELLNEMYAEGDANVSSTVTYTILGGAFGGNIELFDSVKEYMEECTYVRQNGRAMIGYIKSKKK